MRPSLLARQVKAVQAGAARALQSAAGGPTSAAAAGATAVAHQLQQGGVAATATPSSPRWPSLQQAFDVHSAREMGTSVAAAAASSAGPTASSLDDPLLVSLHEHLAHAFREAPSTMCAPPGASSSGGDEHLSLHTSPPAVASSNSARQQARALADRLARQAAAKGGRKSSRA